MCLHNRPFSYLLIIAFFFLGSFSLYGKDWKTETDSLKKALSTAKTDSQRVILCWRLSIKYEFNSPDTCEMYGNQVLEIASNKKYTWFKGIGDMIKGDAAFSRSSFTDALQYYLQALNLLQNTQPIPNELPILYGKILSLYSELKDYRSGEEYANKNIAMLKQLNQQHLLASAYNNAGDLYEKKGALDTAKTYYLEAVKLAQQKNITLSLAIGNYNLASVHRKQGKLQEAFNYLKQAFVASRAIEDTEGLIYDYIELGRLYLAQQEVNKALIYADSAIIEVKKYGNLQLEKDAYYLKSDIFDDMPNTDSAYFYYKKANVLKDSLYNEFSQKLVTSLTTNQKILHLEELNDKQTKNNKTLMIVGGILAVALIMILLLHLQKTKHNKLLQAQNKQIEEQKAALASLNQNKDKLISIMSHDLRSPINQIKSLLHLLNANFISQSDFLALMQRFHHQVDALADNLENILQWVHAQMRGKEIYKELFDIESVIKPVIHLYETALQQKNLQLTLSIPTNFPVYLDKEHLKIALRNLLGNAIKFSHQGGEISIKVYKEADNTIIKVMDNGLGMNEEQVKNLFNGKKSVSTLGTLKEEGTGIGLKLTKEFIEKSGGRLEVSSQVFKGSIFSIIIPQADKIPV